MLEITAPIETQDEVNKELHRPSNEFVEKYIYVFNNDERLLEQLLTLLRS